VITQDTLSSGNATPTSPGIMGGYPSTTNGYTFIKNSDIESHISSAVMPEDSSEVTGDAVTLQLREENFEQVRSDVYAVRWTGGGGFGDPLDRSPDDINDDLENLAMTEEAAASIYGAVVIDGQVDAAATEKNRQTIMQNRLSKHNLPSTVRQGEVKHQIKPSLNVQKDGDGDYWACAKCSTDLGATDEAYKNGCIREDHPVSASNPLIGDPSRFIDDAVSFRQVFCPGCGCLVENEVAVDNDQVLNDIIMHS